jgi:calcineurin-like phosphoesterase family protein
VRNWNAAVGPDDIVFHHGDVGLGREAEILEIASTLNGEKHLISGNHDACWPGHRDAHRHQKAWLEVFASAQAFARRRIDGQQVLLAHLPYSGDSSETERYAQYRLRDEGLWLLCGHVHSAWKMSGRQVNVGVDVRGLAPVPAEILAAEIRSRT